MRVLILSNRFPNASKPYAAMFVKRHIQLHQAFGAQIQVVTPSSAPQQGIIRRIARQVSFLAQVLQILLVGNFDVVHAHWPFPAGLFGALFSILRHKPFVLTSHGAGIDNFEQQPWPIQQCIRAVLQRANVVIAVGKQHQTKLLTVSKVPAEKVFTIPMGIWREDNVPERHVARGRLALSNKAAIVIFIGNLESVKGPDILLKAISQMPAEERNFSLYIGGQGPLRPQLENMANAIEPQMDIHFLGAIAPQEVATWLAAADICIVPSRSEAYGLVALEAMNSNTAVIAADIGGLRENIQHGYNGLLFPSEDSGQLKLCLQQLLADSTFRYRLANAGVLTSSQHDMGAHAQQVFTIYQTLTQPTAQSNFA